MAKSIPGGKPYKTNKDKAMAQNSQAKAGKNTVDKLKVRPLPGKKG